MKIVNAEKDVDRGGVLVYFDNGVEHYVSPEFIVEIYIESILGIRPRFYDASSDIIPCVLTIGSEERLWFPKVKEEVVE